MSTRWPFAILVAVVGLSLGRPHVASAQAAGRGPVSDTAMIPRDLALALIGGFGSPGQVRPEIVVGRLPADFPPDAVPTGVGTVLGGIAHPDDGGPAWGSRSTAVLAVRQAPDAALAAYEAHLGRTGWRRPDEPPSRGGFVPGPAARPAMFCRDSTFLTAWAAPRSGGDAYLRIHFTRTTRTEGRTPCDRDRPGPRRAWDEAPMPTLQAPAGATSRSAGTGGGSNMSESHTRLESALSPAEVVAHYAAQLRQAGWTLGAPLAGEGVAAQTAQRQDVEGRSWYGLLSAVALPGTAEREVSFRVMRLSSRR